MIRIIKCNHSSAFSYFNRIAWEFHQQGFGAFILISSGKIPEYCLRKKEFSIKPKENIQDYAVIYIKSTSGKYGNSSRIRYILIDKIKHIYDKLNQ